MPVFRRPDGNITEKKTEKSEKDSPSPDQAKRPLPPASQEGNQAAGPGRFDAATKRMETDRTPPDPGEEEKTRLVGGRAPRADTGVRQESAQEGRGMDDPVVGWLVIVEGPGKGRAVQLGYGSNSLGRGATDRVKLDFGDDQISRNGHAVVTYDPRGRKFYVQHGGGTNLTYLGDRPVLAPTELPAQGRIGIGNTVLRFVPFCGFAFDWQDSEGSEDP